jgi:hypothetical protein
MGYRRELKCFRIIVRNNLMLELKLNTFNRNMEYRGELQYIIRYAKTKLLLWIIWCEYMENRVRPDIRIISKNYQKEIINLIFINSYLTVLIHIFHIITLNFKLMVDRNI